MKTKNRLPHMPCPSTLVFACILNKYPAHHLLPPVADARQLALGDDPATPAPDSAAAAGQSDGTTRSSPSTIASTQQHGAAGYGKRGDNYPADLDGSGTITTTTCRGKDAKESSQRGNVGGERRNSAAAAGGASPRASPSGSSTGSSGGWGEQQEYRIDGIIRRQQVSAGGLCTAR